MYRRVVHEQVPFAAPCQASYERSVNVRLDGTFDHNGRHESVIPSGKKERPAFAAHRRHGCVQSPSFWSVAVLCHRLKSHGRLVDRQDIVRIYRGGYSCRELGSLRVQVFLCDDVPTLLVGETRLLDARSDRRGILF